MRTNKVTLKAGGEAGTGIATIGAIFAKIMQRSGLYVFSTNDYPSLIRGGHNTITIRAHSDPIHCLYGPVDVLIALDRKTIEEQAGELAQGGAVIYDSTTVKEADVKLPRGDIMAYGVPLTKIARDAGGEIFFNNAAVGATLALLGMKIDPLKAIIEQTFGRKGPEVVAKNMMLNGNDAVCLGAIRAGARFVAEYPMSPSSSVLHWMAAHAVKYNLVVKHTEDEISAINHLCGAGFAGVRALNATSGGGFSLMVEALGNAGIAEIPCVIVNVQRCGPSTGLPTYTEQADLQFTLHASQGEFPRIVCMPGDPEEAFFETVNVFNMAELVQAPAIILMDKYVSESSSSVTYFDLSKTHVDRGKLMTDAQMEGAVGFKRHELTEDGISPRCLPGQKNGIHVCSSYEHDETGFTSEDPHMRMAQIDKRARKMKMIPEEICQPSFYGDSASPFLLVSWGSTKGVVLEAMHLLARDNVSIRFMHIKYASPFASETIREALQSASTALICEGNSGGQMRDLIREKTGMLIPNTYLRYDGRPFEPQDIASKVKELMK
jgi:2-oxoglutarate/2-oxoacid ferredoxin oxidoreductase subunit alpha